MDEHEDPFALPADLPAPPPTMTAQPGASGSEDVVLAQLPCACPCGCARPSTLPGRAGIPDILRRAARCQQCLTEHTQTPEDEEAFATAETRKIIRQRELARWRERVEERYPRFVDATTDEAQALDRLERLKAHRPAGLLIYGDIGSGKTHTAFGFLHAAVQQGLLRQGRVLFGSEQDLLSHVAYAPFAERERLRSRLCSPAWDLVFADDVGWGKFPTKEDQHALWHDLTDHLSSRRKSLVITTNLDTEQFVDWVGAAAMSRIREIVGLTRLTLDGNIRGDNAKASEEEWRSGSLPLP